MSTKEAIKEKALSLFARKGYYGTSISDITDAVGITKSSLYSHYKSKDELFLAVSEDVHNQHGRLFERLIEDSKTFEVKDRLRFNFKEYILYFYRNADIRSFSNQTLFHVPPELFKRLRSDYLVWEKQYRSRLEEMFRQGMERGIICKGDSGKMVWSFKAKRDGVLGWICVSTELTEESINDFWNDFWFGVKKRR